MVGYMKPPPGRRFRPGQSGNPRGRPRRDASLAQALGAELDKRAAGDGGKARKRDLVVAKLVDRAADGNMTAIRILFGLLQAIERHAMPEEVSPADAEADRQVMERLVARLWAAFGEQAGE